MNVNVVQGLLRYKDHKIPTGDFLKAVLENNLVEAFRRADLENRRDMYEIVQFCYNELPASAWGSPEKVKRWLNPTKE